MSGRLASKTAITFEASSSDSLTAATTRAEIRVESIRVNTIVPGFTKTAMATFQAFVTGQVVDVTGGQTLPAYPHRRKWDFKGKMS